MSASPSVDNRPILDSAQRTDTATTKIAAFHADIVAEVKARIKAHDVVVVGMAQNPVVKKARAALDQAGIAYSYLEYGSYLKGWKPRLAIKLWSGWPTFPQVFVKGTLVGGNVELRALLDDGSLKTMLERAAK